jgi:hypothetical protein
MQKEQPESRPTPCLFDASALLKGASLKPVFVRLAFRTALPLPQRVGASAETLMLRLKPEVVGAPIRPTGQLPEQIGALATTWSSPQNRACLDYRWRPRQAASS